jgi:hypothetical protein
VNNTIVCFNVGHDDGGVFHFKAIHAVDGDWGALDGGDGAEFFQVGFVEFAGDDVEGEDAGELGYVLHEGLDGAGGEFGEGVVGGGEDGEGSGAFQGLDEVGGGDGGDEGFEGVVADGDVYDVWHGFCCFDFGVCIVWVLWLKN